MTSDTSSFAIFTQALGTIGIIANSLLMGTILFRTPAHMRVYSRILAASAVCDLVGVLAMMISITKQHIFNLACMLEFEGVCAHYGVDACCAAFGVQAHVYGSTCLLLALSFAYRLSALDHAAAHKRRERLVIFVIVVIIAGEAPLIPLFHMFLTRQDPAIEEYRQTRGFSQDKPIGTVQMMDPFTVIVSNYSMMYALIPFVASIVMRTKIIRKVEMIQVDLRVITRGSMSNSSKALHEMLVRALNIQLLIASCFFLGCNVFAFNLVMVNLVPSFPETLPLAVPLCNLPNVITAITNLYVIKPYRQSLMCRGGGSTAVRTLQSRTDIASKSVSEMPGDVQMTP